MYRNDFSEEHIQHMIYHFLSKEIYHLHGSKMPSKKNLSKYALISTIKSCRPETRPHIIGFLNDKGIDLLSECVYNIFFNDHNLSKQQKYKLRELFKNKEKVIKSIGRKSNSIKRRKRLLVQHGGTLGTILSIAATILSGLLFGHS